MSENNKPILTEMDMLERVRVLFNEVFEKSFRHHLVVLSGNEERKEAFERDVLELLLNMNPLNAARISDIARVFSIYNERTELRNFFNRVYFKFITRIDDLTMNAIMTRLSRALTMRLADEKSGLSGIMRGDKPVGIHQDILNEMLRPEDIHAMLVANPCLIVIYLSLTYVDMESYLSPIINTRKETRNRGA